LSKRLSVALSRLFLRDSPASFQLNQAHGRQPKPPLRDGVPPACGPAPHRAGALGWRPCASRLLVSWPCASVLISARLTLRSRSTTVRQPACCRSIASLERRCRRCSTSGATDRHSSAERPS